MINPINNNISNAPTIFDTDPVCILPEEISVMIFSYFSPVELARNCRVSKLWCRIASDHRLWNAFNLRGLFPKVSVFDESDWTAYVILAAHGLSVADASPSYKRKLIPVLKNLLPSLSIEGDAGVTVLTIPKGLTIKTLVNLAASTKKGNVAKFAHFWNRIIDDLGDVAVDRTYRIVITNNILQGSRQLSVNDQKNLVSNFGCELPSVLEVIALIIVTYMSAGERLYNDSPVTYTRCRNQVKNCHLTVGNFGDAGVVVISSYFNVEEDGAACVLGNF